MGGERRGDKDKGKEGEARDGKLPIERKERISDRDLL